MQPYQQIEVEGSGLEVCMDVDGASEALPCLAALDDPGLPVVK